MPKYFRPGPPSTAERSPSRYKKFCIFKRDFSWPLFAQDIYKYVGSCTACVKTRSDIKKHYNFMKLFPTARSLDVIAIELFGPLPEFNKVHMYVTVITDRFAKIPRAILLSCTNSTALAEAFLNHWVFLYGSTLHLLSDHGFSLLSKFFKSFCTIFGLKKQYFTTVYGPQTNGQVQRFYKTLVAGLRHYVEEDQWNWA